MYRDEKWVDKLPYVEFAINSSVADSTGKTTFKLCYISNVWTVTDYLDGMHHIKYAYSLVTHID